MVQIVLLTGGMGAGKSTAAEFFAQKGARVVDADSLAKELIETTPELRQKISAEFGVDTFCENGQIDRARLAAQAFSSKERAAKLDAIVHPYVTRELTLMIEEARTIEYTESQQGVLNTSNPQTEESELLSEQMLIIEIPLIEEVSDLIGLFDEVLAISSHEDIRKDRLIQRGFSLEEAQARIDLQVSDEEREALASSVIRNDDGVDVFLQQLERWWMSHSDAK